MTNWCCALRKRVLLGVLALTALVPIYANAQSSACTANEDVVTFDFGAANATNGAGSTRTWTAGTTANTYNVATVGSVGQNTISLTVTTLGGGRQSWHLTRLCFNRVTSTTHSA